MTSDSIREAVLKEGEKFYFSMSGEDLSGEESPISRLIRFVADLAIAKTRAECEKEQWNLIGKGIEIGKVFGEHGEIFKLIRESKWDSLKSKEKGA